MPAELHRDQLESGTMDELLSKLRDYFGKENLHVNIKSNPKQPKR